MWVVVRVLRTWVLVVPSLLLLGLLPELRTAQAAEPPPLRDFFRNPAMADAEMSPNGKYIAALMPGGPHNRQRLAVIDVNNFAASKVVAEFDDADIAGVEWVNDDRLVFMIKDVQSPAGEQPWEGLFAVDRNGIQAPSRLIKTAQHFLTERPRPGDRSLSVYHRLFSTLRDGSNDVVVMRYLFDARYEISGTVLLRLDTVSGTTTGLGTGSPADTFGWAIDRGGNPRVTVTAKGGKSRLFWKPSAAGDWVQLREYDTFANGAPLELLALGANDQIYGVSRADSRSDTASLQRIEVVDGKVKSQTMLSVAGFDYQGHLRFGKGGELLGVDFLSDAWATHWYDPTMKSIQAKVDALLPGTGNHLSCGQCTEPSQVLVRSSADRQPAIYLLYDVPSGKLQVLAQSRPWIKAADMAVRDFQRITARDGMSIPVYITRPRGVKGPAPMVVLVHGGPYLRGGEWAWGEQSQFLASRGYVVIEPEFRGSTGYGWKLFQAGWKQWGLGMQDDLEDAARWAVKQGYADEKRICIAGASYGGYATLMGLIRDPDLYRCGVEWVGVSDIDLLYSNNWSDMSAMWKDYGMPVLIGDREKDAAQLNATSPLKQAAKLKRPLLMAYGSEDRRVPLEHGTKFRDAVKAGNADVEFVVYPGEAHGWMLESTKLDFWGRVERFLARNLAATP